MVTVVFSGRLQVRDFGVMGVSVAGAEAYNFPDPHGAFAIVCRAAGLSTLDIAHLTGMWFRDSLIHLTPSVVPATSPAP